MTVQSALQLEKILQKSSPPGIFLFHGEDEGLSSYLSRLTVLNFTPNLTDPFSVVRLSSSDLANEPGRLVDEAGTIGLFSGKRSIWVDAGSAQTISGLAEVPSSCFETTRIVIEASELRKDSALLKFAEQTRYVASFACPCPSEMAVDEAIRGVFSKNNLSAGPGAVEALKDILPADWLSIQSELEKLVTYCEGRDKVDLEDVAALIVGGEVIGPDEIVDRALTGDFSHLEKAWSQAQKNGLDGGVIAGFALRRLLFRRPGQSRALDNLSPEEIRGLIQSLSASIRDGRREPRLADSFAQRAFWGLATRVRRR